MLTVLKQSLVIWVTKGVMQILYFRLPIHTYLEATLVHLRHIDVLRGIEGRSRHSVIIFVIISILCTLSEARKRVQRFVKTWTPGGGGRDCGREGR